MRVITKILCKAINLPYERSTVKDLWVTKLGSRMLSVNGTAKVKLEVLESFLGDWGINSITIQKILLILEIVLHVLNV